jgi:FkbM family methyltransferase
MKYFFDCGTYYFQGLKEFSKIYKFDKDWTVFSYESNPFTYENSKSRTPSDISYRFFHENKAVWKNNDPIIVHCEGNSQDGCASTVLDQPPDHDKVWKSKFDWKSHKTVQSIRLSDALQSIKDSAEKVVVKLDIEGAEFEVLEDLISTDSLQIIDDLYVEFHERFFMERENEYRDKKSQLVEIIKSKCKKFEEWK